jgi:uncharacterized membrane protein
VTKTRLEAFSDGVFAIIITIMVLELRVPGEAGAGALTAGPQHLHLKFLCYVLSFVHVAIYWNNHHHLIHASRGVSGAVMWANMHLLFWLSLFPFGTAWIGETGFARVPTMLYGAILLLAAIAYYILARCLLRIEGSGSVLGRAMGRDLKGKMSPAIYVVGIVLAAWWPAVSTALYGTVALIWLVPDRRIVRALEQHAHPKE